MTEMEAQIILRVIEAWVMAWRLKHGWNSNYRCRALLPGFVEMGLLL